MKNAVKYLAGAAAMLIIVVASFFSGCGIYKFNEATVPDSIRTVKVNFIENRARYVNPQLSQRLTDRLRQKIVSQTRLSQTNNDNADWEVSGEIREYNVTTSGISNQSTSSNRLTVAVHIVLNDRKSDKTTEYDVSRQFDFNAALSLQEAEGRLAEEMLRSLTDDIFNRLFSNW